MNINEVEKQLSITRANIRFYEKEGLISPRRKENNYRDYSDEDVLALKKVLIFRKLGFTIEEIAEMQKGGLCLDDALDCNIKRLEDTISELEGSLKIARQIKGEKTDFESLDEEHYWDVISSEEQAGGKFADVCKDYLKFELEMIDTMLKWNFFFDFKKVRKTHGVIAACVIPLLICIGRGVVKKLFWQGSFWEGFLEPFGIIAAISLLVLPIFVLSKKSPKAAGVAITVMFLLCIVFLALIMLLLIVLLLNHVFHFGF